ncbi:hypothetical protein BKA70DRAFT_1222982 [Coprinopsis sp. MPI-PUGE-AT-0042]|nr:hypothetical protein BKA70DRAFT_1222982 [Coprinopsis sp. MPI-PUGE-AT-0042]
MAVPMYYNSAPYSPAYDAQLSYTNDPSTSVTNAAYLWGDNARRSSAGAPFHPGYMSAMRTPLNDSPRFEQHMLPSAPMPTGSHVPRTLGYMPGSPASTDSDDCSEPTASLQWTNYNSTYERRSTSHHRHSRSNTTTPDYHLNSLSLQIPQFPHQQWNTLALDSSITPYTPHDQSVTINGYVFPHSISPVHTPSPPPSYNNALAISTMTKSPPLPSSRPPVPNGTKKCSHCQATTTPLWRRDPSTFKPLCNACGLYLQQRNRLRPQVLIDADIDDGNTTDEADANYVGPECSHCRTHHTSVWRRSKTGAQLCNACGVYLRLRGKPRPLHLKKNKIKPRSKHPKD